MEKSVATVTKALREGAILVIIILYLFLRNVRASLGGGLTLPLAVLATFIIMGRWVFRQTSCPSAGLPSPSA